MFFLWAICVFVIFEVILIRELYQEYIRKYDRRQSFTCEGVKLPSPYWSPGLPRGSLQPFYYYHLAGSYASLPHLSWRGKAANTMRMQAIDIKFYCCHFSFAILAFL